MSYPRPAIPGHLLDPRFESLPAPPSPNPEFNNRLDGVVIPVWQGDVYLAKACCASVRRSMGDIPITLFVDGTGADTRDLQRLHGVERLDVHETGDAEAVRLCTGTPWTKIMLFWMSPYERFLCLDADALIWGDLRAYAEFDKYDFIFTHQNSFKFESLEQLQSCASDPKIFEKLDPLVDWRGKQGINTGVFFGRRGVLSKEKLMTLRRLDSWSCYEAGVFQFLYWQMLRDGYPRATAHKLQLFPAEEKLPPEDRFLRRDIPQTAVIHWITKKPKLGRCYRSSTDYRKLFLRMTGRTMWPNTRLLLEDTHVWLQRQRRSWNKREQQNARIGTK